MGCMVSRKKLSSSMVQLLLALAEGASVRPSYSTICALHRRGLVRYFGRTCELTPSGWERVADIIGAPPVVHPSLSEKHQLSLWNEAHFYG